MASSAVDVTAFLNKFLAEGDANGIWLVPRQVNQEGLAELGLTKRAALGMLKDLGPDDYCGGPQADRDQPGQIWLFGLSHNSKEVYIKLKLDSDGAKCISFHPAKHQLKFPLRNSGV